MSSRDNATALTDDVLALLDEAARKSQPAERGSAIRRKDRQPAEPYDYIYGLEYIEPKYTLLFQDAPIEQLSPGQRGALLLIFYLLIDKRWNPIILTNPRRT